jgi:hypothetical protein
LKIDYRFSSKKTLLTHFPWHYVNGPEVLGRYLIVRSATIENTDA